MNCTKKSVCIRLLLISAAILLILACSLFGGGGAPAQEDTPGDLPEVGATRTSRPVPQGEPATEAPPTSEVGACPQDATTFGLQANHHFWTSTGMGDWVWQASGGLQVSLDESGVVSNTGPQTILGMQSGTFSRGDNACSFEAPAEVFITIQGSCAQSVLSLEIWEDWQMGTYDWTCDDESFQFELPDQMMPPSAHKVEYDLTGMGSYSYEVPFGGGSGTKMYTLVP